MSAYEKLEDQFGDLTKNIVIPYTIKSFIHKNVDFQLFIELLSDILDR
jgi:hypothetical protein